MSILFERDVDMDVDELEPAFPGRPPSRITSPLEKPSQIRIAWAAGLIEYRGSFVVGGNHSHRQLRLVMQVPSAHQTPIRTLRKYFGGSIFSVPNDKVHYVQTGARLCQMLRTLWTYLSAQRRKEIMEKFPEMNEVLDKDASAR